MNNLNEQFIGEEVDCEALGIGTIVEITGTTVRIATEFGIAELDLDDIELGEEAEKSRHMKNTAEAKAKYNGVIGGRKTGLSSAKKMDEEGQNKPYVKPNVDSKGNQSGWKASNKHGNVKFFGTAFKATAMKHAGMNEETLDEGRGRKPKEPSEGQKPTQAWLRHLERQKGGGAKDEVEALGAQLRKAVSINKDVTFLNGDKKKVTASYADRFHDHMDSRRTSADKQKFQNAAHASHDSFMKAVKSEIPKT
jgi:hypothetical protein